MIPKIKIKTKEDRDALLSLLGSINQKVFTKEGFGEAIVGNDWNRFSWFGDVKSFFEALGLGSTGYDSYTQEIKNITGWVSALPEVKIALPFEPTKEFVEKAYDIVSGLEPEGFVLDVTKDKSILSGGKLFYKGHYIDLTLRSRINYLLSTENAISRYL
jgi:hypothetical protein